MSAVPSTSLSTCLPRLLLLAALGGAVLLGQPLEARAQRVAYKAVPEFTAPYQIRKSALISRRTLEFGRKLEKRGFQSTRRRSVERKKVVEMPRREVVELPDLKQKSPARKLLRGR